MAGERIIGFRINIKGSEEVVKTIAELEANIKETTKALKEADIGEQVYKDLSEELANSKAQLQEVRKEQRVQIKEAQGINAATGSYRQLNAELVVARNRFKDLSREDREGDIGKNLTIQIQKLDKELKDLDKSIGNNQRNVGNYASAFEGLGSVFSGTISDIGALVTGGAGLAVLGTLLVDTTSDIKALTDELFKLQGAVEQLTGATGADLDEYTARIAAIADTFGVGTDEVLQSANALTEQLTGDFGESLTALESGFIAGADAQGELLDSTKEYAVFVKEAGLDVNDFINIINQSTKEGLFSDKGIDTVKEAVLSLRELPKTAEDALNAIGITGEEVTETIGEKGIGAAIALVSNRLGDFEDDSREVGQVLADIFKGAGEDVGVAFVKSLATLGEEFGELEGAATDYAVRQARILELNTELRRSQVALTNEISGGTGAYEDASIQIQTSFTQQLVRLIQNLKFLLSGFTTVRESVEGLGDRVGALGKVFTFFSNIIKISTAPFIGFFTIDFPAALAGAGAAVRQFAINASNFFTGVGRSFQITILNFQKALSRGEAAESLRKQINQLKDQQAEAEAAGITVGEAFNKGFEDAVQERTEAKAISEAAESARREQEAANKEKAAEKARGEAEAIAKAKEAENERIKQAKRDAKEEAKELKEIQDERDKDELRRKAGFSDELTELSTKPIEAEIELSKELQDERKQASEDAIKTAEDTAEAQIEQIKKVEAAEEERRQRNIQRIADTAQLAADTAFQIAEIRREQEFEDRQADLEARLEAELEGAAGNEAKQQEIREKFAAEEEKLRKEQAAKEKRAAISQAIINGALAATKELALFGLPAAIPFLIAIAAQTAAQLAIISAQKFNAGGVLSGPSHERGGIPVRIGGGNIVEAEGGEAIINKKSTARFLPILSRINQAGGGVPLMQNGGLLADFGLPSLGTLSDNGNTGVIDLINEIRAETVATTRLALSIRESQLTQRVVLDTEELDTVQAVKVELDSLRSLT